MEKATFAAGCFWSVEAAFAKVKGVILAVCGYTGGSMEHPTYQDVCTGSTGHAEAVELEYDEAVVSYDKLLDLFWSIHDPTTVNRQGPDIGSQYRSAIFFHNPRQEAAARAGLQAQEGSGKFGGPVVTEIVAAGPFYRAEEYHQRYHEKHGIDTCHGLSGLKD